MQHLSPETILREYFGFTKFREHQKEIIQHLLSGNDAFVLMPTGSGKSLCYQIPAMIRSGVGIVVSPLIALMQDQVDALRQVGIRADFLNSSLSIKEAEKVMYRVIAGESDLLYVAPERLMTTGFQRFLNQIHLGLFAIDEAHCVSQWGHDFRPEYLQIAILLNQFPHIPRIALTATADTITRKEILEKLALRKPKEFISSFDRPNICYRVELRQKEKKQLLNFLYREHVGDSGIIYCLTRKKTETIAEWLSSIGYIALPYHAGMDQASRLENQRRFLREENIIIVATIAFGMGIDKPNVRFVVHLDMPKNLESYYQETGRAGRDGKPANAWMLYGMVDIVRLRKILDSSAGDARFIQIQRQKLESMLGYCETTKCRRQVLLQYFGEKLPMPCGNCNTCQGTVETWDGTIAAQKALSCVYRTGQRFGSLYLTDVLMGNLTEKVSRFGHDKVSTYGIGKELSLKEWQSVFRQLVAAGFLHVNMEGNSFYLSPASRPVLRGEQKVWFRKDPEPIKTIRKIRMTKDREKEFSDPISMELWEKLRALRLNIAQQERVPPYVIFHDITLREMVNHLPSSLDEMKYIDGVGKRKLESYGNQFLEIIIAHIEAHGLSEQKEESKAMLWTPQEKSQKESNPDDTFMFEFSTTVSETLRYFKQGKTPEQIAELRELTVRTIYTHLSKAIEADYLSVDEIIPLEKEERREIEEAFHALPEDQKHKLKPIFEKFEEKYDYGILGCIRAGLFENHQEKQEAISSNNEKSYDVKTIRQTFPKAYAPWTKEDDTLLKAEYLKGKSIELLTEQFQRNIGAINSRLRKLELINVNKKIICLANSRKYSGYCIAGKELLNNQTIGKWIRPVSNQENGELSINHILLQDGSLPKLMDVISVSLAKAALHTYQRENYLFNENQNWMKIGEYPLSDLSRLCDDVDSLWIDGYSSSTGINDRIPQEIADKDLSSSLLIIKIEKLCSIVVIEKFLSKRIRVRFDFKGIKYCLPITDPEIEKMFLKKSAGEYSVDEKDTYFTVSISEPFEGYCYKLVAGVITTL